MPNHLASETSPYLQQHADNPVDWRPWGEEALARAKRENRPILLSIGYSACHWCHVMAHESFEDPEVAAVMNRHFVNIKVDREERPDLDQIYQTAHALLTQRSGGWPLTLFLTPEQVPFFGGTYFPKTPRFGLPGFIELLPQLAAAYRAQHQDFAEQNKALLEALARMVSAPPAAAAELEDRPLTGALAELESAFDKTHGGIGQAPKFPHSAELEFCLRRYAATGGAHARHMALHTLQKMAEGGLYDQLGGGFCRDSGDQYWTIPDFEKMHYDNGPLLRLYADAWRVSGDTLFKRVAEETAGWVMREMQSPEGGYYSSLDADSEHEEGKFYVGAGEVGRHTTGGRRAAPIWTGRSLFRNATGICSSSRWRGLPGWTTAEVAPFTSARESCLSGGRRVHPGRDDKILVTGTLSYRGMAGAGIGPARMENPRPGPAISPPIAVEKRPTAGHLQNGRAHSTHLDDHAFLLDALLELMQAGPL